MNKRLLIGMLVLACGLAGALIHSQYGSPPFWGLALLKTIYAFSLVPIWCNLLWYVGRYDRSARVRFLFGSVIGIGLMGMNHSGQLDMVLFSAIGASLGGAMAAIPQFSFNAHVRTGLIGALFGCLTFLIAQSPAELIHHFEISSALLFGFRMIGAFFAGHYMGALFGSHFFQTDADKQVQANYDRWLTNELLKGR